MGKLARLNAEKKAPAKEVLIAAVKVDGSYEVQKEDAEGKKITEKVNNLFYIPLSTGTEYVSSYNTREEADQYFTRLANATTDERTQAILFSKKYVLLAVKYAPNKKGVLRTDWADKYLLRETPIELKKYKSAKQI